MSFLKPFNQDELDAGRKSRRAPPIIKMQFEKEIFRALDDRTSGYKKKNRRTEYFIQWKGESVADATWEKDVTLWRFECKKWSNLAASLSRRGRQHLKCRWFASPWQAGSNSLALA